MTAEISAPSFSASGGDHTAQGAEDSRAPPTRIVLVVIVALGLRPTRILMAINLSVG